MAEPTPEPTPEPTLPFTPTIAEAHQQLVYDVLREVAATAHARERTAEAAAERVSDWLVPPPAVQHDLWYARGYVAAIDALRAALYTAEDAARRTLPSSVPAGQTYTVIPTGQQVTFPWCYGDLRAGSVTLTGYLAEVYDNGSCRVDVDGVGYHPKLADVRAADERGARR